MRQMYEYCCLLGAHELICMCGIYVAFEGHICFWQIYGNSMVNMKLRFVIFLHIYELMWGLY